MTFAVDSSCQTFLSLRIACLQDDPFFSKPYLRKSVELTFPNHLMFPYFVCLTGGVAGIVVSVGIAIWCSVSAKMMGHMTPTGILREFV